MALPTRVNVVAYAPFSSSGGNVIAAPAQSVTTGNALIVLVGGYANAGQVVASVTDTAGNTYVKADHGVEPSDIYREEIWYAKNITGHASNVVTATWSAILSFTYFGIAVIQYAGLDPVAPLDGTAKGTAAFGLTVTTGSLVTTRADSVHVMFHRWGNGGTITWPAGFSANFSGDPTVTVSERFVGAAHVGAYTLTQSSSAPNFAVVASFASPSAPAAAERVETFVLVPV